MCTLEISECDEFLNDADTKPMDERQVMSEFENSPPTEEKIVKTQLTSDKRFVNI